MKRAAARLAAVAGIVLLAGSPLTLKAQEIPLARQVAEAEPGAVVIVPAGLHRGAIRIERPMTLVGVTGAIIDGNGHGDVICIAAPDVTVRNLTIRNSGTDLTAMNAGIFVEKGARDAVIADNTLEHVLFGVYLDGPSGTKVTGNRIRGLASLRRPDRGDGIHLWNDKGVLVEGNDISETRDGIYIYVSPDNAIIGNRMHGVRYGVHYMYSNHDRVTDNLSFGNRGGFALMQSDHLDVERNESRADRDFGILLNYVTYSELAGNTVRSVVGERGPDGLAIPGGEGKGIFIYNSEFDRFHDNTIADSPIGIHITAGSESDVFYRNAFVGNRVQLKYVQNREEEWSWHGVGNYWSDYLGWDLNGDGYGDVPYRPNDGVDILLWKYPTAALLLNSPAMLALRYVQRAFPVFVSPGVHDSHPLMRRPGSRLHDDERTRHAGRD